MRNDLCSKDELIAEGWSARQIDAALDEPDEVGPSGHWLNTSGKPYYLRERVSVAAFRTGITEQRPNADVWERWINCDKPTSIPVLTFDLHRIANECQAGIGSKFRSLRISHPVLGRLPGTRNREVDLVESVLQMLVKQAYGVFVADASSLSKFFFQRSEVASAQLGITCSHDVIVRSAHRASYVSRAAGRQTVKKFLDALALVHVGVVRGYDGAELEVQKLLTDSPQLRFDLKAHTHK